jgi:uncharacterized membrane protein YozB (DUF420 family)
VATIARGAAGARAAWLLFWLFIGAAGASFVYDSILYVAGRDPQPGSTLLNRHIWFFAHMTLAIPILVIAPLQFLAGLRRARPKVHRRLGRAFLASSILAGATSVWLGATIQYEGSRIPLAMFGLVWIGFSAAAWILAVKRDFANHRRFVIRSFAIGLAFIWVRLLGRFEAQLFPFITDTQARETTLEYLSFILPLLVVELWLSWLPPVLAALRRR